MVADLYSSPVYAGLLARGLPEHVAQGIMLNLQDESGLNPGINEAAPVVPGSRGGFGLAQWTGPRRVALEQFAAGGGRPLADANTQLDFLMSELQGPERGAFDAVMATQTPGDAAAAFASRFLRPAPEHLSRRVADYTGASPALFGGPSQTPNFNPNVPMPTPQLGLDSLFAAAAPQRPRAEARNDAEAEKQRRLALFEALPGLA